jgi:cytochrome b561
MSGRNTPERYGALSIGLHWLMLLLLVSVYACIELRGYFPKGSDPRQALKAGHFMLGLSVLALVALRVVVRAAGASPRIEPEPPHWQRLAAKAMHLALYAWMIGMPLLGWLALSAEGHAVAIFGMQLPPLIDANDATADWVGELHEAGGTLGYFLIGLHAVAALYHHHVVRDNTLLRMLPGRR